MLTIITTICFLLINNSWQKYEWKECSNKPAKCDRFDKPPMVLLSLDGFRNEYLNKNIVKTLDYLADCGAKAKHVYPSYPSKTFPNHYTMATGLYPESHGIVDNQVYDPDLKKFIPLRFPNSTKYWGGEPIWSMYKRYFPSKKVFVYFWPGSETNLHPDHPIDEFRKFDTSIPLENRLQEIVNNLEKEKDKVPGLIIAYHNEPDATGHFNIKNETAMNETLRKLDDQLNDFINKLYQKGILDCINLVIVSDHGMQPINVNVDISKHLRSEDLEGVVIMNNIIGTMHNIPGSSVDPIFDKLSCKIPDVNVYNKKTIPTRKHYSSHRSIGDLVLEGNPGVTFQHSTGDKQGDHGYDYMLKNMYAIFLGRGPAFKKGIIVEPFQNVQLMNLWIDLLEIHDAEKTINNGTFGFFDTVLISPRKTISYIKHVSECIVKSNATLRTRCNNKKQEIFSIEQCRNTGSRLALFSYRNNLCYENYCQDNLVKHTSNPTILMVSEELKSTDRLTNMPFYEANYLGNEDDEKCEKKLADGMYSISVRKNLVNSFIEIDKTFYAKVLKPLDALTNQYLTDFKTIHVISGTTIDANYDGRFDFDISRTTQPTHFYRIIIICPGGWRTVSPPKCMKPKRMQTLSFIFPIATPKAWDCITSDQLLKDYTATIIDVERIAGYGFEIEQTTPQVNANIRQRITEEFWKIEDFDEENVSGLPSIVPIMIFVLCFVMYFF